MWMFAEPAGVTPTGVSRGSRTRRRGTRGRWGRSWPRSGQSTDRTITVRLHDGYRSRADELAPARIERARAEASRQLARTRDVLAWQTAMAIELGLDAALPAVYELESKIGEFGRGERSGGEVIHVIRRIATRRGVAAEAS